jgi:hypothetical protein
MEGRGEGEAEEAADTREITFFKPRSSRVPKCLLSFSAE